MEKRSQHLAALFTLCVFFGSGVGGIHGASGGGEWCVAKEGASDFDLRMALNYACGEVDCSSVTQPEAVFCYTLHDQASYAFNEYYQKNPQPSSCVFNGVATLTSKDPSHGNCHIASVGSGISPPSKPSGPQTPQTPQTPQPLTPVAATPPSPGHKASPNGATLTSFSFMLFFACALLASL